MIFDTDVIIWYSRGDRQAAAWIDSEVNRAISVVTVIEVLQGARSLREMKRFQQSMRTLKFQVLPLSESIGYVAAALIEEHALTSGLQLADALIAATALEAGEAVATGNARHFQPVRNLEVRTFRPHSTNTG